MLDAKTMAKIRQHEIRRKESAQKLQSSGYVPSQMGHLTSQDKLIKNGHYARTGEQLKRDNLQREIDRINKKLAKQVQKIVLVKR